MKIKKLRNKLLLSAVSVSMLVALTALLAVSFVIRQQNLDQANSLLHKAVSVIGDHLTSDNTKLLAVSHQLATQKNIWSTIWYLEQYAQSDIDRETLLDTYQKLTKDIYKISRVADLSEIAIYDSAGMLVSFAKFDNGDGQAGFVERSRTPRFQIARLKAGEEPSRNSLQATNSIANLGFEFGGKLPQQESVQYTVLDGMLAIECKIPIMGEAFDSATRKQKIRQLGLIVMVHKLGQPFVDQFSNVTDTHINVFSRQGFSVGTLAAYRTLDISDARPDAATQEIEINEIVLGDKGYYQSLMPLYVDKNIVGTIAVLYSKDIVQKNIREMIKILGAIAAVSLLVIFTLAWYFATSISQPLEVLSRVFRVVASGKQTFSLQGEFMQLEEARMRADELGDLTQSFIAMNDAVNQKIQEINDTNASLEKKVEERTAVIEHALTEQSRFMSMLTHELKTPISVVRMSLGVMKEEGPIKRRIERALEDMNDIVERCIQLDQLEQQKLILHAQRCSLDDILSELRLGSWAPDRLSITTDSLPDINTDQQLLRIILSNLINNAIKYSRPETVIEIHAESAQHNDKPGIRMTIQNQPGAAGLPDPGQLFIKYYRSPGAYSKTGSGLGLYLVRSITELLGGQVTYDVVKEKVRFTLWIPC
jgi:signal transduction histidine kinase